MPTSLCAESTPSTVEVQGVTASVPNGNTPVPSEIARTQLNFNRDSFCKTQPTLNVPADAVDAGWVVARDGSLTVRDADGWWAGCSLPLRAARQQLKSMEVSGPVACLLDPVHAAHLRTALDNLKPSQAVLAIVLDATVLPVLLGAFDFSADIAAHRLWIVAGQDWSGQLRQLFRDQPGLSTPMQFVRLPFPDSARLDPVIAEAQNIFREANDERSAVAKQLRESWTPPADAGSARIAILTGTQFRVVDDAALVLQDLASSSSSSFNTRPSSLTVNADDPACGSTLALVTAATACGILLTADVGRGDLPELLPRDLPWLTWVTTPRIPSAVAAGPGDRLLVADPAWREQAMAAGWIARAVGIAGWPALSASRGESTTADAENLPLAAAIIADTSPLDAPDKLEEFSSHLLLWSSIRRELHADPLAAGTDAEAFLRGRMRHYGVDDASLDRRLFVSRLIWPAVTQGIARRLMAESIPLQLVGKGWGDLPEFASASIGGVTSRRHLAEIAAGVGTIVDARPAIWRNGLYSLTRPSEAPIPVVRTAGRTFGAIRHDLSQAMSGQWKAHAMTPPLDLSSILARVPRA